MDIDPQHIFRNPWVAGAAGAIVALRGAPGETWRQRIFNIACGTLLAGYLSDGVSEFFGLTTIGMQSAGAFLLGLFGMNLIAAIVLAIQNTKLSDLMPWRGSKREKE